MTDESKPVIAQLRCTRCGNVPRPGTSVVIVQYFVEHGGKQEQICNDCFMTEDANFAWEHVVQLDVGKDWRVSAAFGESEPEADDEEELPDGWQVTGWSRNRDGFAMTVYKMVPPAGIQQQLDEPVLAQLMQSLADTRYGWHASGDGVQLNGNVGSLTEASRKAEDAVDGLLGKDDGT